MSYQSMYSSSVNKAKRYIYGVERVMASFKRVSRKAARRNNKLEIICWEEGTHRGFRVPTDRDIL